MGILATNLRRDSLLIHRVKKKTNYLAKTQSTPRKDKKYPLRTLRLYERTIDVQILNFLGRNFSLKKNGYQLNSFM